jgi:glutamyl/glutaminyl-tRNA synthetase
MGNSEWYKLAKSRLPEIDIQDTTTQLALLLDKNRVTTLSEFGSESDCILHWTKPSTDEVTWKKISTEDSLANLKEIADWIISSKYFNTQSSENLEVNTLNWETLIKKWLTDNQKDTGSYLWPLRVALSGKQKSPSPFELLSILSKEEVENRINQILV